MEIADNESAKFWLNILNELKNRGVQDILVVNVDNLKGLSEAIAAVSAKTEILSSTKFVVGQEISGYRAMLEKQLERLATFFKNSAEIW